MPHAYPPLDVEVRTPRLVLAGATDDLLERLVPVIRVGVVSAGHMPFDDPMSLYEDNPQREWKWRRGIWAGRARVDPQWWRLYFVVMAEGSHRPNLVVWSQSAGSADRFGALRFTRTRRIRRCIRTGALLAVVGLMPLARGGRARWWLLLGGGVLMLRGATSGMVFLPGLVCLAFAPLVPARAKTDRMRRSELERELGVYSHPAQRRLAIQAMAAHDHRFPVTGRY